MTTITIVSDNSITAMRPKGLVAEWGFGAIVGDVLFDTGQTGVAAENARALNGDATFDTIVLSHGHYDHVGGLPEFLDADEEVTVHAHPDAFRPRWSDGEDIGCPYTYEYISSYATIVENTEHVEVAPGIHALGEIPRTRPDNAMGETIGGDGTRCPDPVRDDQALVVESPDGLTVVFGCGHAGVRNTVEYAESVFDENVTAIIGGTHLVGHESNEVIELVEWMNGRLDTLATSHCTGTENEALLSEHFDGEFTRAGVGTTIEL